MHEWSLETRSTSHLFSTLDILPTHYFQMKTYFYQAVKSTLFCAMFIFYNHLSLLMWTQGARPCKFIVPFAI